MFGTWGSDAVRGSLTEGDGVINGMNWNDVIHGTDRSETLYNETGDALLVGGGGNDTIWAGADNAILDGGSGRDTLYGEAGDDTYIFRRGSEQDTIIDSDATEGNIDTIWLGGNLTPDDIVLRRSANDFVLRILGTSDTLTVRDFFRNDSTLNHVERIEFMDGTVWTDTDMIAKAYAPTEDDDVIYGSSEDDNLSGAGGGDTLYGLGGEDVLHGDAGKDRLYGGPGADILDGGTGDDFMDGGAGEDLYLLTRGCGQDTINDQDTTPGNIDRILVGDGILPGDIRLQCIGNDLKVDIADTGDSVTVTKWLQDDSPLYGVEAISFADGTVWGTETIQDLVVKGTEEDDVIHGFSGADFIQGFGGDDIIDARGGDDILDGGPGSDTLSGEAGNDVLRGGEGADTLLGGAGDDVYLFDQGSGNDTILDRDRTVGNVDTVRLADGLTPDNITLQRNDDDLELSINGTSDRLTVQGWFWNDSPEYQVERIHFGDGTEWNIDAIKQIVLQGTSGDDTLIGYSSSDALEGHDGQDRLFGRGGDDMVQGGAGTDFLSGEAGNDTLEGGEGGDTLVGGLGDDVLDGGVGSDAL